MRRISVFGAVVLAVVAATAAGILAQAPAYRNVPLWPQPLPNHWVLGSVTGVTTDAQNHVWVVHRGADSLEGNEKGMMATPPTSSVCCTAAPFVLEFDGTGKLVSNWGGPGQGYQWPLYPGGIAVDGKGNVWIAAAGLEPAPPPPPGRARGPIDPDTGQPVAAARGRGGPAAPPPPGDAHVIKFSRTGQFVLQIGTPGKMEGPDSQTTLNRPAAVAVDDAANEVYVADSGNHRVVVFDANTGAYKRHWGGSGDKPTAQGGGAYDPNAPPGRQFRDVTCVKIAKDGMVYVCDRTSDRIQVFQKDGKFVKEGIVAKETTGVTISGSFGVLSSHGSVWDLAFSNDPQQRYVFVADGQNKIVRVLQRDTLAQVGTIGSGGRYPGQFLVVSTVAVDGQGNLYTGEQHHGKRVQKFVPGR
jgi:hypothetical protein